MLSLRALMSLVNCTMWLEPRRAGGRRAELERQRMPVSQETSARAAEPGFTVTGVSGQSGHPEAAPTTST